MKTRKNISLTLMAMHDLVSGSCLHATASLPDDKVFHFLVDRGLNQEWKYRALNTMAEFDPNSIDFMCVTHAHTDHCGMIPFTISKGFRGNIYCSKISSEILPISFKDSYKISAENARRFKTKPPYTFEDVSIAKSLLRPLEYNQTIKYNENISITLLGNGHILGAASVLIQISYPGVKDKNVLITGDYAPKNKFVTTPDIPEWVKDLKNLVVIQESTYGYTSEKRTKHFSSDILKYIKEGKNVIIPCIALERSEQVFYELYTLQKIGLLDKKIPIGYHTPLGTQYLNIYSKYSKIDFLPENLRLITHEAANDWMNIRGPKITIATSGMCDEGPVKLYLNHSISDLNTVIYLTCHQVEDTFGYSLLNKKENDTVKIMGEKKVLKATITFTDEFSSHATADKLLSSLKQFKHISLLLVTHGSLNARLSYMEYVRNNLPQIPNVKSITREFIFSIGDNGLLYTMPSKLQNMTTLLKEATNSPREKKKRKVPYLRRDRFNGCKRRKYMQIYG